MSNAEAQLPRHRAPDARHMICTLQSSCGNKMTHTCNRNVFFPVVAYCLVAYFRPLYGMQRFEAWIFVPAKIRRISWAPFFVSLPIKPTATQNKFSLEKLAVCGAWFRNNCSHGYVHISKDIFAARYVAPMFYLLHFRPMQCFMRQWHATILNDRRFDRQKRSEGDCLRYVDRIYNQALAWK